MADENHISTKSDAELVQAWLDNVQSYDSIEHVGAANRHFGKRIEIIDELKARSAGNLLQLRPLLQHPDPKIRYTAALEFRTSDPATFRNALIALQEVGGEIGQSAKEMLDAPPLKMPSETIVPPENLPAFWQPRNPPTTPMHQSEIARRLFKLLPGEVKQILGLARPAIGLWPKPPRVDLPKHASRLGGTPNAPPGFVWPMGGTEPMLFLGQINCADLNGLPGSEHLPSQGLLVFFGDHDTINGCMFTALGGAVFHWPEIDDLVPALPPLEVLNVFLVCELAFRPLIDLPHPESRVVRAIISDESKNEKYRTFHQALRNHGIPDEAAWSCGFCKLLGWPHLVQGDDLDFYLDGVDTDFRLLLQLDSYSDGRDIEGWGPGGSLYFMIPETDFSQGRLEASQLTGQFT